ncbi:MAG: hypothetical protein MMC33_007954 [Icmadophila ericetorum]|nr:hypothetical protein [Icmadophila ericetorum]
MTLKDLLKKKDKLRASEHGRNGSLVEAPPNITITRSDTTTNEILFPHPPAAPMVEEKLETGRSRRFRSLSNASSSNASKESKGEKRISQILHLRSHSHDSSVHVPTSLPSIDPANQSHEETEAQWEARATLLAKENFNRPHGIFPGENPAVFSEKTGTLEIETPEGRNRPRRVDDASSNDDIQEAIRLHESGELSQSTAMFGRLADPEGENNVLSQVLYGLALRHGWGIEPDPTLAVKYLSFAASNSASIESQALAAGMKKGGAAKGELVLAIYELANCFRHGWGVEKDPVAARSYYETAANLGDTDAMNEVARCYEEGSGGKKDKVSRASIGSRHWKRKTS